MTPWNPTFFAKNVPIECLAKMNGFASDGARFRCVVFPFEGGNRWSVITDKCFFNRGIPDECHDQMREFSN